MLDFRVEEGREPLHRTSDVSISKQRFVSGNVKWPRQNAGSNPRPRWRRHFVKRILPLDGKLTAARFQICDRVLREEIHGYVLEMSTTIDCSSRAESACVSPQFRIGYAQLRGSTVSLIEYETWPVWDSPLFSRPAKATQWCWKTAFNK